MSLRDVRGGKSRGGLWNSRGSGDSNRLRVDGKLILLAVVGFLVICVAFIAFLILSPILNRGVSDEEILMAANREPITQNFISMNPKYSTNITFISKQDLVSLSEKYPAIYGDLDVDGLYRVEYSSDSNMEGVLLIMDRNKKVLKYYRVRTMGLTV